MTDSRILSIALSAIREGRDIVVIAIDRDDAELLAEQIIQRAAAEGLCVAESIGDQYELCSEVPLIYARAYEQECATWEGRTRRPLVAVRHSSAMSLEALSYRPPTFRRVLA